MGQAGVKIQTSTNPKSKIQNLKSPHPITLMIGDISCRLNARSPDLRCAVNPLGPCEECLQYQPINFD